MKHIVEQFQAKSGARGVIVNAPGSNVVSLEVRFNSGYQFTDRETFELPHVMEHMLAAQTKRHPGPNEFMVEAQKNGAYVNAGTSTRYNSYTYECAEFELDRILDLLEEQLTEAMFSPEKLEVECNNVKEELGRNITQHAAMCALQLSEKVSPWLWLGYEERIKQLPRLTAEACEAHFRRTHVAANARYVVAGDFHDAGAGLAARLEHIFAGMPQGERLEPDRRPGLAVVEPVRTKRALEQIYYRAIRSFGEVSDGERRALVMLRNVLVGGMGSRIYGQARQRGLAYGVGAVAHADPGNSSFGFTGHVSQEHAPALFELMGQEMTAVAQGKLTKAELAATAQLVVGSVLRSTQTASDLLGWYIEPFDDHGEVRDFEAELKYLQAVQPAEVSIVAQRVLDEGKFATSFVGEVSRADDWVKSLGAFASKKA
jgi:predicted Zn-dependent peptidase